MENCLNFDERRTRGIRGALRQAGEGVDKRSHVKSVLHILDGVAENMILINKVEGNYLQ